jgi:anti-anti-sigma regulatory factor
MRDLKNRVPLQISNGAVIVPIRYEVTRDMLNLLREDLLNFISVHAAHSVVFDLKGIEILDADDFSDLQKILKMINIMGLRAVLCGLSAGVVATLVALDVDAKGTITALDLNSALALLNK